MFVLTVIVADIIFLLSGSFVLAALTGVIGGAAWAHSQRAL